MRTDLVGLGLASMWALLGCSGRTPTNPAEPTDVAAATESSGRPWSLTGRVTSSQDGQLVPNAEIAGAGEPATTGRGDRQTSTSRRTTVSAAASRTRIAISSPD